MSWISAWAFAPPLGKSRAGAYGCALAAFLAALVLRLWLDPILPPGFPYLTFFPAVVVTAFLAGTRPAIACAALSGLASWYFFLSPSGSLGLTGSTALALAFYVFIVAVDVGLIHLMGRGARRLAAEREVTAGLYDQQRLMFQELQHRVANNMAFVSGLLHLQKRQVASDPSAAAGALEEATARLDTMARIHRRLYDPASVELPVGQYFQEICADILTATDAKGIVVLVDMPAVKLDIGRLMTLSLLVTEVVTNSLKHAFEGRPKGTIRLNLERLDPERMVLTIRDDGRGLGEKAAAPAGEGGLGTRIIRGLATQLRGELTVTGGEGVTTRLVFQAS